VADPRHQTLTAAIGWSYDLLPAEQRRAFRGLSVFAGGFSLAVVAIVCCGGDQAAALDLVDQLASKSLVVAEPAADGTRYRMLETIRQYAASRLAEAGDFDAQGRWRATRAKVLARHGQFRAAVRLAEEAVALVPATCDAPERAEFLVAQAEVARLAGALGQAEDSLRQALQFYESRRMVLLAEQTRALLASLARQTAPQ
jgi:predicted ATPase